MKIKKNGFDSLYVHKICDLQLYILWLKSGNGARKRQAISTFDYWLQGQGPHPLRLSLIKVKTIRKTIQGNVSLMNVIPLSSTVFDVTIMEKKEKVKFKNQLHQKINFLCVK